mmetsp:Transcript_29462/g.85747  ORF Transcript_29462/g.85747 Transcript_29462/m.85747 type:complete len:337 (-) Transcript_29462:592-1602(-)
MLLLGRSGTGLTLALLNLLCGLGFGLSRSLQLTKTLLLLLPSLLLLLHLGLLSLLEAIVVALVRSELAVLDVKDLLADRVEEILVMRYDKERLLPLLEVGIQPDHSIQIKMVRRLVQHQKGRLNEECPSKRDTHPPTTGELLGGLDLHLFVEAETIQNLPRLGLGGSSPDRFELIVHGLQTSNLLGILVAGINGLRQDLLLFEEIPPDFVGLEDSINGGGVVGNNLLLDVKEIDTRREDEVLRRNHLQQSGFTLAVGPDETIAASMGDVERRILEQNLSGGANVEGGNVDIERVHPLRVVLVHSRLRAGELSAFRRLLGRNLFILGHTLLGGTFLN